MSLLGKLLALLNVLAATAFFYLATTDWAKRYAWSYAVFRHELVVRGLPVDDREHDLLEDIPMAEKFSEETLRAVFQPVGGNPVPTQAAEVQRVKTQLTGELDALGNEQDKRVRLAQLMLPLARSPADYDAVAERIGHQANGMEVAGQKVSVEELLSDFNGLFDEVMKPEADGQGASGGTPALPTVGMLLPRDRREAIVHLLFNVLPTDDYHYRLQVVVGVKAYNLESSKQADALAVLTEREKFATLGDRSSFEYEYSAMLNDLRERAEHIDDRTFFLGEQQRIKADNEKLVEGRKKKRDNVLKDLNLAREEMMKNLNRQSGEEEKLFEAQRVLGGMIHELERLEEQVRVEESIKKRRGGETP